MDTLSIGFCEEALTHSLAPAETLEWKQRWPQPTLQIVDIQRYPVLPSSQTGPSRFYVLLSDGKSLLWGVVPPQTEMEEQVAGFQIDVGCCVTMKSYTVVTAANGLNVLVPLRMSFSHSPLRLLGHPAYDSSLFDVSEQSLLHQMEVREAAAAAAAPEAQFGQPTHPILLREFVDSPQCAIGNWSVWVRVVWKDEGHLLHPQQSRSSSGAPRYAIRCLITDIHGDAIPCCFFGGESLVERLQLYDCLHLAQGTVKWGTGELGGPVELQFTERSINEVIQGDDAERGQCYPLAPIALVGETARLMRSAASIVSSAAIDETVHVVGTVRSTQAVAHVNTKRGRVLRSVVTLEDEMSPQVTLDVTLWGEIAESAEPKSGERWCFTNCTVREFMHRKTLSSRMSTMAVRMTREWVREGNGVHGVQTKGNLLSSTVSETDAPVVDQEKQTLRFAFDLNDASTTLPVLVRIQSIEGLVIERTCVSCQVVYTDPQESTCNCGASDSSVAFSFCVVLSDSLQLVYAKARGSVGEFLFEMTPEDFLSCMQDDAGFLATLRAHLVGTPLLAWFLPTNADSTEGLLINCRRVNLTSGAQTLLYGIEAIMEAISAE